MEKYKLKLQADEKFFALQKPRTLAASKKRDVISVGSTSSESSVVSGPPLQAQAMMRGSRAIVISDDDDSETEGIVAKQPSVTTDPIAKPRPPQTTLQNNPPTIRPAVFNPSLTPANLPVASSSTQKDGEDVQIPNFRDDYMFYNQEETEKQLREMLGNSINQDVVANIDLEKDAIVPGFREGIKLLPHQIVGRAWMKHRESGKAAGGILADDMGLGKTIQTLARIVEGKPHRSDKDDGWSGCTLVVCPLALVGQWVSEVEKMTELRVVKHQGQNRTTDPAVLRRHHVVVTTYDTVKSEYDAYTPPAKDESKKSKAKPQSRDDSDDDDSDSDDVTKKFKNRKAGKAPAKKCALFGIRWWRIVLDEAHTIKNVKTKGAVACCELESKFKWCLTGTPMQNNVSELQSLFKFLHVKPYSDATRFNVEIAKPINTGRGAGSAMKRLQVVLKSTMLRRRKEDTMNGKALIELPARNLEVISCPFDSHEKTFYESLEQKMESALDKLMSNSNGGSNYMSVLLLLLRLRQACNHPLLVSKDFKKDAEAIESSPAKGAEDPDDLIAAFGQLGVTRKCQMCTVVIGDRNSGTGEWKDHCTSCIPLAKEAKIAELERPTSAKIRMMLKILRDIDEKSNSGDKTIIFSQFTSMLDLIEPFLKEAGVKFVRYDGSMMPKEREISLEKIRNNAAIKVILISFKAGSTGLNLTACNHVILIDMWWNPALEDQAFDRAHRFGQKKDVTIYKLKIDETVEDRILELQAKKRALSQAALSGDKIKNMRLGMEDLLALFRPGRVDEDD